MKDDKKSISLGPSGMLQIIGREIRDPVTGRRGNAGKRKRTYPFPPGWVVEGIKKQEV